MGRRACFRTTILMAWAWRSATNKTGQASGYLPSPTRRKIDQVRTRMPQRLFKLVKERYRSQTRHKVLGLLLLRCIMATSSNRTNIYASLIKSDRPRLQSITSNRFRNKLEVQSIWIRQAGNRKCSKSTRQHPSVAESREAPCPKSSNTSFNYPR